MNKIQKALQYSLFAFSIITTINTIIMYWCPLFLPFSSFSVNKITFWSLAEQKYCFVLISLLLSIFLFVSLWFIYKKSILGSACLIIYFSIDFVFVMYLFVYELIYQGYFMWFYVLPIIIDLFFVILCILFVKINNKTERGRIL